MDAPITSEQKVKRVVPLSLTRLAQTEYVNQDHSVTVDIATTIEDMRQPDYWANAAPHLTQYDRVRAVPDDGRWYAEFLIVACDRNSARVELINFIDLDPKVTSAETPIIPATHEVRFRGPHHKWCAIRVSDGALLKTGMKRDEANLWLAEYLKVTAKVPA